MKKLGRSDSGGFLVELTAEEMSTFNFLCESVDGRGAFGYSNPDRRPGPYPDLATVLGAIEHYATTLGHANTMYDQVKDCRDKLRGKSEH